MRDNNSPTPKDLGVDFAPELVFTSKPKSVLEAFETIVDLAENSGLSESFLTQVTPVTRYASRKLKLTSIQVVLLALFVNLCDGSINPSDIAGFVDCKTIRLLRFSNDIDALIDKHYIVSAVSRSNISYRVPFKVVEALKANKPYVHRTSPIKGLQSFFDVFDEGVDMMENRELSHERFVEQTVQNLDQIKETAYAQTLKNLHLSDENILLFTFIAYRFVYHKDDCISFWDIRAIFDNGQVPSSCKCDLRDQKSELLCCNLIENICEDGRVRPDAFKITKETKKELLSEIIKTNGSKTYNDLLKHETFAKKTLIYNQKEKEQIDELSAILSADRFKDIQNRLEKAGMRKGFCCLFYGEPGTGKTETVYQIARQTGRDILRVDVEEIKSCWVGESEKNIKSLFDRYRRICSNSELAPILLFNEADAVLGVRMEGAAKAVDKMENSLQNIILQEMESLDGIMIATTNLTTNLDKAFERRFLYKIRYEKPTKEGRAQIWQTMLPGLNNDDACKLASEYNLSGGEIENIVRKHSVAAILSGDDSINVSALSKLCQSERINVNRLHVGF